MRLSATGTTSRPRSVRVAARAGRTRVCGHRADGPHAGSRLRGRTSRRVGQSGARDTLARRGSGFAAGRPHSRQRASRRLGGGQDLRAHRALPDRARRVDTDRPRQRTRCGDHMAAAVRHLPGLGSRTPRAPGFDEIEVRGFADREQRFICVPLGRRRRSTTWPTPLSVSAARPRPWQPCCSPATMTWRRRSPPGSLSANRLRRGGGAG